MRPWGRARTCLGEVRVRTAGSRGSGRWLGPGPTQGQRVGAACSVWFRARPATGTSRGAYQEGGCEPGGRDSTVHREGRASSCIPSPSVMLKQTLSTRRIMHASWRTRSNCNWRRPAWCSLATLSRTCGGHTRARSAIVSHRSLHHAVWHAQHTLRAIALTHEGDLAGAYEPCSAPCDAVTVRHGLELPASPC